MITIQKLIALLPFIILICTIIMIMLCIAWKRNHYISIIFRYTGLSISFLSLWLVQKNIPIDITPLIHIDGISVLYMGIILISGLCINISSHAWFKKYEIYDDEFYLLMLLSIIGGIVLACSNHFTSLFLGIELISLPLFGMIGYISYSQDILNTNIKYMFISIISSLFLLFGISLIYSSTGYLSFLEINKFMQSKILIYPILYIGFGMIIIGCSVKLSLVPFHLWTPEIYQNTSTPVSLFLTTVYKISIFLIFIRMFICIPIMMTNTIQYIITIMSFFSMLYGNLMAINQNNIKRILAYSSISHTGSVLIGIIALNVHKLLALESISIYLIGYILSSLGIFNIVTVISLLSDYPKNKDSLHFYRGLFWKQPMLSLIMTIILLSLAGMPMTIGFIGKFYIMNVGINSQTYWLLVAIILSSIIGLLYYFQIISNLYLPVSNKYISPFNWIFTLNGYIILLTTFCILLFGLYPQPLIKLIEYWIE